jgi:hypothetical protein
MAEESDEADFFEFPPGIAVPPFLKKLADFQTKLDELYSGNFQLTEDACALACFDGDEEAASKFVLFGASDADDSSYGYWLYKGQDLTSAPIVFLGSEGTGWTTLANSLEEFFGLLACGVDELGYAAPYLGEPEGESVALLKFRRWLKRECGIEKPAEPSAVILKAQEAHPDLQEWLQEWQKSHFGE